MSGLLEIRDVSVVFQGSGGFMKPRTLLRAVDRVSFDIAAGETLALVGESGSGKTTLGHAVAGLRKPTSGTIHLKGKEVDGQNVQPIQIVFQDPFSALDPRMLVGDIIAEPLRIKGVAVEERRNKAIEMAGQVGLPPDSVDRYPHEFSGGQRQRIAIARTLIADPELIVADEPLSALDVSVQSQILNLLSDLKQARGLAYLFISHDLAVVHHLADRVAVFYLGRLMELASRDDLFGTPSHPYTQALLATVPRIGRGRRRRKALEGEIPSPLSPPSGCVFHTRCPKVQEICRRERPELLPAPGRPTQISACHFKD
jgi:oligopeptide/dipeptide ABC transporter ATP-binding protein